MPRQARRSSKYDLVSFENPPVAEVALTAQFGPDTVDLEALGLFAHEVRDELPVRQQQPMAPPMDETFDAPVRPLELVIGAPGVLPRTWFLSEDGIRLVQLQHDRVSFNWREADHAHDYPRYEELRKHFVEVLERLKRITAEAGRRMEVNLTEVTYVNPIEHSRRTGEHDDLAKIINRVRRRPRGAYLPEAEDAQLHARWRIPGDELHQDAPIGRLYLSAVPGLKPPKNVPIYMVNMTARVIPRTGDIAGVMQALDVAHKWVVLGFKDVTTTAMHQRWGLREGRQ